MYVKNPVLGLCCNFPLGIKNVIYLSIYLDKSESFQPKNNSKTVRVISALTTNIMAE